MIKDVNPREPGITEIRNSLGFAEEALDIIGQLPSLITSSGKNPDAVIDEALGRIGVMFSASRVYVMLDEKDGRYLRNTHEWVNQKIGAVMYSWPLYDYEYDVPSLRTILNEQDLCYGNTRDMPDDLGNVLSKQNVKSFALAAIYLDGVRNGLVGMDFCNAEEQRCHEYGAVLRYLAGFVALALERKQYLAMRSKLCLIRGAMLDLGPVLDAVDIDELAQAASRPSKPTTLLDAERRLIIETLELYNGNKLKTAKHLGLTWPSLDRRCKKLGIEAKRK